MNSKIEIKGWVRDLVEVAITLGVIILLSRLLLGAQMLVPLVAVTSQSMLHESNGWENWLISHGISAEDTQKFPFRGGFARGDMIVTITPDNEGTVLPFFSDTGVGDVVIYERDKPHQGNEPPIIHRVVGIVQVSNWSVESTEGTLACLTEENFRDTYVRYVKNCVDGFNCLYTRFPETGDFRFYITKGDNNQNADQCSSSPSGRPPMGDIALPVTDAQLTARGWIAIPYVGFLKLHLWEALIVSVLIMVGVNLYKGKRYSSL
jgi:signal peptidase I